jgi:hypothetical protein
MPIVRRAHIVLPIAGHIAGWTLSHAAANKHTMMNTTSCSTHSIPPPDVFGARVLSLTAGVSYDEFISPAYSGGAGPPLDVTVSYCGVNVFETHLPTSNVIPFLTTFQNVYASWLARPRQCPRLASLTGWNGRVQSSDGGGWSTGYGAMTLAPAVPEGYAAATTDGGHTIANLSPVSWGLRSPGNVDHYLLQDFASVTLIDKTIIGKQITEQYYQTPPQCSYWKGWIWRPSERL